MLKTFLNSCLDLLFPRICPHCGSLAEEEFLILCKTCFTSLEFTQNQDRCRACGQWKETGDHCSHCQKNPSPFYQVLTAFDQSSPAAMTLQRKYQNPSYYFLTKGAGALMAFHYAKNGLKWPQVIVPFTSSHFERLKRGFCPSNELAKEISAIFQIPLISFKPSFLRRHKACLEDKKVLLVGDCLNPSFFEAGHILAERNPHSLYGLSFSSL